MITNLINKLLSVFGYTLYSKKLLRTYPTDLIKAKYKIDEFDISYIRTKLGADFKEKLLSENKNKWLDIGCGGNFEDNFFYIDKFSPDQISKKELYIQADIVNLSDEEVIKIGKFDFIRMQHVFEHFTPEEGLKVLNNCAKILNPDGYILVTTPDLKKFISMYVNNSIKDYYDWAITRIEKDSPASFYFSIFTHSVLHEQHKWCYDADGLIYQFEKSGMYKNIKELKLGDEFAGIPFTHNRPIEDVCVFAQLK